MQVLNIPAPLVSRRIFTGIKCFSGFGSFEDFNFTTLRISRDLKSLVVWRYISNPAKNTESKSFTTPFLEGPIARKFLLGKNGSQSLRIHRNSLSRPSNSWRLNRGLPDRDGGHNEGSRSTTREADFEPIVRNGVTTGSPF